jgi:hypothetical protein
MEAEETSLIRQYDGGIVPKKIHEKPRRFEGGKKIIR